MQLVGLLDQCAELLANALQAELPPWIADQVRLQLVEYQLQIGGLAEADSHLEALLGSSDEETVRSALLKLAALQLRRGDRSECLESCRKLLGDEALSPEHKSQALRMMGRVFELQSQHYAAALCYAGMVPSSQDEAPAGTLDELLPLSELSTTEVPE
jgi:hypothetical protein